MNTPINWPYQRLSVLILPFTLLLGSIASDTYPEIFVASMLQYFIRNKGCYIGRGKGKNPKRYSCNILRINPLLYYSVQWKLFRIMNFPFYRF